MGTRSHEIEWLSINQGRQHHEAMVPVSRPARQAASHPAATAPSGGSYKPAPRAPYMNPGAPDAFEA